MRTYFVSANLTWIPETGQLRCDICGCEFYNDRESRADHARVHRRRRELSRQRGMPLWSPQRVRLEHSAGSLYPERPLSPRVRAILALNRLGADYYNCVDYLVRRTDVPIAEIDTFMDFVSKTIETDPSLAEIRDWLTELASKHEFTVRHRRRLRQRLRRSRSANGIPREEPGVTA